MAKEHPWRCAWCLKETGEPKGNEYTDGICLKHKIFVYKGMLRNATQPSLIEKWSLRLSELEREYGKGNQSTSSVGGSPS